MKIEKVKHSYFTKMYLQFDPTDLKIGDAVESDIYIRKDNNYVIIIEAGSVITEKIYNLLNKQEKLYLLKEKEKIVEEERQVADCDVLQLHIKKNKNNLSKTLKLLYETNNLIFNDFINDKNNKIDVECIESIVKLIIFLIRQNKDYLKNIMPLIINDHHLDIHSLNVAIYSLHIGTILKFDNKKLVKLGKGALLHDIGAKESIEIQHKSSALSQEEFELIKKHPDIGVEYLEINGVKEVEIIDVIKHHHERCDGSGYPEGLQKKQISELVSIVAICDVFDALTIDRPYRKHYSTFDSLKIMMKDPASKDLFNHAYIKLLLL